MPDSTTKPIQNRRGLGAAGAAQKQQANATAQASGVTGRSTYQQRLDEMKVRIIDLSHRNMESALRIMRTWMKEE